jgi:hypothetical protein
MQISKKRKKFQTFDPLFLHKMIKMENIPCLG